MASNPLQSALRRFVQKSGVAFFWAFLCGALFGAAAYFRVERLEVVDPDRVAWHVNARLWLEKLERWTFDWRARELGAASQRSDEVVLLTVDEETIANARASARAEWAARPWPRALIGEVVDQAIAEGAALVVVDLPLSDVSAHHCAPCRGAEPSRTDDQQFANTLERHGNKVVLTYDFGFQRPRPSDRALTPVLLRVAEGEAASGSHPLAAVRAVLARRTTAYLVPEGEKRVLWAGAVSDAQARELAAALELRTVSTRGLLPSDDALEVDQAWLVRQLAGVSVRGLDPSVLPRILTLEAPVAEVLSTRSIPAAATVPPDIDGVVRAVPLLAAMADSKGGTTVLPSAPLRALMLSTGISELSHTDGALHLGSRFTIPIDQAGFLGVRWDADQEGRAGRGTLKRAIPAWRLLVNRDDDQAGRGIRHHDNELAGRLVVLTDARTSAPPLSTPVGTLSRAAVLGQTLTNLLRGTGITRTSPETDLWLTLAFAVMGSVLAMAWSTLVRRPGWLAWVATLGFVIAVHALAARQLMVQQQRWVAMAAPLCALSLTFLASLGYARAFEQGLREFVLRALGGAVRADVFQRVEQDLLLMRPERRDLVIYFSDIEGFTTVAQAQEPRVVVAVVQQYLAEMTNVVLDRQGHVDKYLGDGLMAFWGAPVAQPDHVASACDAALEIRRLFERHRTEWEQKLGRALVVRAGIDRGPTLVGEMGTFHRVNYTVMGEPVAATFRLESLAKRYGASILVGQSVAAEVANRFVLRQVDRLRLGRSPEPVTIYELVGRREDVEGRAEALDTYAKALAAYYDRQFLKALALFRELGDPPDKLVARYLRRCERLVDAPPPETWDGVYPHHEE